jgi:hypothetical protein
LTNEPQIVAVKSKVAGDVAAVDRVRESFQSLVSASERNLVGIACGQKSI